MRQRCIILVENRQYKGLIAVSRRNIKCLNYAPLGLYTEGYILTATDILHLWRIVCNFSH